MALKTPLGWLADRYTLSPRSLRWATTAALVVSILIVLGGGVVRVTGSGLGCPTWPTCDASSLTPTPAMGIHAVIEFSNRMLTTVLCLAVAWVIIAARLQKPRVRSITRLAWSQFWLVVANAIAGGISVWTGLNPYVVAFHFVMAMALLTTTTLTWHRVHEAPVTPDALARITSPARALAWTLVALTAVLIVVGTLVSGSGPHSGDTAYVPRMDIDWIDITLVHATLGTATLGAAIALIVVLRRARARLPLRRTITFLAVVVVQALIGTVQALTALPDLLVALHLMFAALVWVGVLRVLLDVNPGLFLECTRQRQMPRRQTPRRPRLAPGRSPGEPADRVARLLSSSSALFWGLQFAFLNPVLALLLVSLFHATPTEVGWSLAVYNTSGFVASLVIPLYADRTKDYLRPMLLCGALTLLLAGVLLVATSLPVALIALVVLGGPAGVGSSLLFAQLKFSGASNTEVVNTRAIVSFAWVAGPPLATLIMGGLGDPAILPALALVAVFNIATTIVMMRRSHSAGHDDASRTGRHEDEYERVPRSALVAIIVGFIALQATNSAAVSIMSLFVTQRLGLPLIWSGIALGVSALLEIPALILIGRLGRRFSSHSLIISGCVAGIAYYTAMTFVADPVSLIVLQVLNAWFFGVVAGVGLTLFLQIIPRPGLASGLYTNTRRIGAIVSGAVIAFGSASPAGYQGVFAVCAALTVIAIVVVDIARRISRRAAARPPVPAPGGTLTP